MNTAIPVLVFQIIEGLKNYFEDTQIQLEESFYEELLNILTIELSKPFDEQIYTPTQMLNDYIKNKLSKDLKITPHKLGDELNNSLILWGIEKAKFFNEK
mgnify:CR=1 FL=1|tara:strand:- start:698 stop:997 length:300 start_codon:yes stop_codon:yes gene_type:complete